MNPTPIDLSRIGAGFKDPALEAQQLFRKLLDAMARPGRIQMLAQKMNPLPQPPQGLNAASAAIALTLLDFETPVWLSPELRDGDAAHWLRFHCGCPLVTREQDAAFAIVVRGTDMPRLGSFNRGEDKYPERSTTVIVQVDGLTENFGIDDAITLRGPGIRDSHTVSVAGLVDDFWIQILDNGKDFQLGVDVMLTHDTRVLGLPRTVRPDVTFTPA